MRAVLDAPETIAAGCGRYLFRCSGNSLAQHAYNGNVSVPCSPFWLTLPENRRRVSVGYGRYDSRIDSVGAPQRCPCGAWLLECGRLEVDAYSNSCRQEGRKTHTCENTCQWSESRKCRCACGGRRHGEALREYL